MSVAELLAAHGVPGAAVGVLRHGEVTEYAVGVRDAATGAPVTTDTVFQCGSQTKTWTALAFLGLVDEGKAGLDEPVRALLPGFAVADPDTTRRLTPRHLLHHTDGIEEAYGDPGEGDDVLERMVAAIAGAPQVSPLGRTHGYSAALGHAVLARILEVVDGKPWDQVMRDRLFTPMGLTSTNTRPDQVDPTRGAVGHLLGDHGPVRTPVDHLPRAFGPGGGLTSTVGEVLTLAHVLLGEGVAPNGRRIVSAGALREMTHSRVPVPDPYLFGPAWGLGLIVCDWHGRTVYATDGSTIGQNARLRLLPDEGMAVAVLTNGGPRESLFRAVFDEILGAGTVPAPPTPDPARTLDPARYTGVYERPGARYEVSSTGTALRLALVTDPARAAITGTPERVEHDLLAVSDEHFVTGPADDQWTVALYEVAGTRYLHTNARVHPRTGVIPGGGPES